MRLIDADAPTEWMIRELRAMTNGVFNNLNGRQAANLIGKAIDEAPTIGGWISVKDRLPEKAGIYIICDHYGNVMSRHFCKGHGKFAGYWHLTGSAKYGNPRYWMPLPEPPEEVSGGD